METCRGCGAVAEEHPILARGNFGDHPVCEACWREPTHRTSPIKGHFFVRQGAPANIPSGAWIGPPQIGGA